MSDGPTEEVAEGGVNWSRVAPHSASCSCTWCEELDTESVQSRPND